MAIAGGGSNALGLSGSGVSTENKIATLIKAYVDGDGATGIHASAVTLSAQDTSTIIRNAGAASLAGSFAGTGAVSLSIGVALARNTIANEVEAAIKNADTGVTTTGGGVTLSALQVRPSMQPRSRLRTRPPLAARLASP